MDAYINLALEAWRSGAELRRRRARYKDYTYGRQWGDPVEHNGSMMTEGEAAFGKRQPLTNNVIRRLVKAITGNFRSSLIEGEQEAGVMVPDIAAEVRERNCLDEIDSRMLEEFLISGCAIQRVVSEQRQAGQGVWVDNVSPDRFFVNRYTDPRGLDIELVGMLHDMSLREVMIRFGGRRLTTLQIEKAYADREIEGLYEGALGEDIDTGFFYSQPGRCRVIELWTLECRNELRCIDPVTGETKILPAADRRRVKSENRQRLSEGKAAIEFDSQLTMHWHCRYYTPDGTLLDEMDSPFAHKGHPFVVKHYPLTDGEVHSFVEDIIDQQRYVNRLITMMDKILSVSAKGALLYPMEQLPRGLDVADVADMWSRYGTLIPYNGYTGGPEPKQISGAGGDPGVYPLLAMQLQMLERVSGVGDALLGNVHSGKMSAEMYAAQIKHSRIALLDMMESFNAFRAARNRKILATK